MDRQVGAGDAQAGDRELGCGAGKSGWPSGKAGLLRGKKGAGPRWEKERGERAGLMRELVSCRPGREERVGRREKREGGNWAGVLDWAEVLGFFSPFYFLFLFKLNSNYLNSIEI